MDCPSIPAACVQNVVPVPELVDELVTCLHQKATQTYVVSITILIFSTSLHRANRSWYRTFVPPICRSSHVSNGDTGDWIWMPFGVVSGVGLGMGV